MGQPKINHLAIWIPAVIVQGLPVLWYDTLFFGIRWNELNNLTEADFENFSPANFIWAFASAIALGYILSYLFRRMNVTGALEALKLAFVLWFGLLFLELATQNAFSLRPFELTLVDELLVLIKYEIMAVAIVLWKKKEKTTQENLA